MLPIFQRHMEQRCACAAGSPRRACAACVHQKVVEGLRLSRKIDDTLDVHSGEYSLPKFAADSLRDSCFTFNQTVTWLIKHLHPDIPAFHYTIKYHYLLHLAMAASYINPSLAACDDGEDLMKVVKRLIAQSTRGSPPPVAARTAMIKYCRGLGFDLAGVEATPWKR